MTLGRGLASVGRVVVVSFGVCVVSEGACRVGLPFLASWSAFVRRCNGRAFLRRIPSAAGDHGRDPIDLADAIEDDFGAAVIDLDRSVDLDRLAGQPSHVANIFQIVREDNDGEWTRQLIFAEIEEVDALFFDSYAKDFASYAFGFSDVLAGS